MYTRRTGHVTTAPAEVHDTLRVRVVGDAHLQSAHAQTGRGVADIGGPGGTAAEAAAARGL